MSMNLKPLHYLALSLSLMLAACDPQARLQLPAAQGPATPVSPSESVSFRWRRPVGFGIRQVEPEKLAFIQLSLVGEGIDGVRSNDGGLIPVVAGEAEAVISRLPIQPGHLRVVSVQGFDAARNPMPAFVGKGFYISRAGTTRIQIQINRRQWLSGRALELMLASDPAAASDVDLSQLQTAVDAATGFEGGSFLTDPSLFSPLGLAKLLSAGAPIDGSGVRDASLRGPGELLIDIATSGGGDFGEDLTVIANDPVSRAQVLSAAGSSPQSLSLDLSPGDWTLEVRKSDGSVVGSTSVHVDAGGATPASNPVIVSGVVEVPVLSDIDPDGGSPGSRVTLTGAGFSTTLDDNIVSFNGAWAQVNTASSTSLDVTVPEVRGSQTVTVTVAGQTSNGLSFTAPRGEFRVNSYGNKTQGRPDVAVDSDGDFVAVWQGFGLDGDRYGIIGQRYNSAGEAQGGEFVINQTTITTQVTPAVAIDADGDFAVTWGDDSSEYGIAARLYASNGEPRSSEFVVNRYSYHNQRFPDIAMDDDGDFVIVWHSYFQDGDRYGVYARRYDSAGTALDSTEFRVNVTTISQQSGASVAMGDGGDFIVTWNGLDPDRTDSDVYYRLFQADGSPVTGELQAPPSTEGWQFGGRAALDQNGDFVIAWSGIGPDGDGFGVFARRFSADGAPLDSEFQVNSYTTDSQFVRGLAMDQSGDFVVTWTSNQQDGSNYGVYGQRFEADGDPAGMEFRINHAYTSDRQEYPAVAMDADGNFVTIWESRGQEDEELYANVFARRYLADGSSR